MIRGLVQRLGQAESLAVGRGRARGKGGGLRAGGIRGGGKSKSEGVH